MNKKIITTIIVAGIILVAGAFYGGIKYNQNQLAGVQASRFANFAEGQNGQRIGARGGFGATGGGTVSGEILSKDANGITVKLQDGSTKIVLIPDSASVTKFISGAISDLLIGHSISANGTTNTDGSITAKSIQIRIK